MVVVSPRARHLGVGEDEPEWTRGTTSLDQEILTRSCRL
jgi:hypothetical protein